MLLLYLPAYLLPFLQQCTSLHNMGVHTHSDWSVLPAGAAVLLLYEGDANCEEEAKVGVRMVDFAHTFQTEGRGRDTNFLAGLRALLARLRAVVHSTVAQDLAAV
jgi:hypothetical protein